MNTQSQLAPTRALMMSIGYDSDMYELLTEKEREDLVYLWLTDLLTDCIDEARSQ